MELIWELIYEQITGEKKMSDNIEKLAEKQETERKLTLVMCNMNRTAFDFVGEMLPSSASGSVRLRNALALAYGKNLVVDRLDDLHVPKGMIDLAYTETVVEIPADCVAYTVTFDVASGSELAKMYTDFFNVPVN